MRLDAATLQAFYATPLGLAAKRILAHRIRARWRNVDGLAVAGVGFPSPYLGGYRGKAVRVAAVMPVSHGAVAWPSSGPSVSVLAEEAGLPLPDNAIDRLLAVHVLEAAQRPEAVLREFWRVLSPEGRMIVIAPNRRGLWARFDSTPFGYGRPFSRHQLDAMLRGAFFTPLSCGYALQFPPFDKAPVLRWAMAMERAGAGLAPALGGVIVAEARKEVAMPIGKAEKASAKRAPAPSGAAVGCLQSASAETPANAERHGASAQLPLR